MEIEHVFAKLKDRKSSILGSENFAKYAVLLPLIQKKEELHVLFEVRSLRMRRQPGEICFPGGKIDSGDTNEQEAALRETVEELGIKQQNISNVFQLDYLVSPFGMIVYPFVGLILKPDEISANPKEVHEVFTVPLSFFMKESPRVYKVNFKAEPEEGFPYDLLLGGENYNWRTRHLEENFFLYENRVIWGLTARILMHFVNIIKHR